MTDHCTRVKRDERQWQDRQGGSLQERAYARPGTRMVLEGQFARVAEAMQLKDDTPILDLGCGAGIFLSWLAHNAKRQLHGLDLSQTSLNSARKKHGDLKLALGDAESLPYKSESFGRIVCNGAAHHLLDLRSALREINRVLIPGGRLVLYEPNSNSLTNAIRGIFLRSNKYESPADLAHKDEFTRDAVQTMLRETGFVEVMITLSDFLAYPMSGMYMNLPFGRSEAIMKVFLSLEEKIERWKFAKPLCDSISWRVLVSARKPAHSTA